MSRIHVNGPDGPEEVHLLQAEDEPQNTGRRESGTLNQAERRSRWPVVIGLFILAMFIWGGAAAVWSHPYEIRFYPEGEKLRIERKHWVRANGWMILERQFDQDYRELGWCIWAATPGQKPKWHLVAMDDGETVMATRDEWWKR